MEETRISRMYASLVMRSLRSAFSPIFRKGGPGFLVIGLGGLSLVLWGLYSVRGYLHVSTLRSQLKQLPVAPQAPAPRPCGQEAILLARGGTPMGPTPEFATATLLPGCGMSVLQITANVPGFGEVPLLLSPSVDEVAAATQGTETSASAAVRRQMNGTFLLPWAGSRSDPSRSEGSAQPATVTAGVVQLPASPGGRNTGSLSGRAADSFDSSVMPDGGEAQAVFQAGDFDGHWPSETEVKVAVLLSSRTMELTVTAKNTGAVAEPMGIGWYPRFAFRPGSREQIMLKLPRGMRSEIRNRSDGLPSGRLLPVENTLYDFTQRTGRRLGSLNLDDTFVHLLPSLLDSGPVAEVRDPSHNLGIRLTALTMQIKALHVEAPVNENYIAVEPRFNYDDPLGREWGKEDNGMVVLQPGQSTQWKIRVDLFALTPPAGAASGTPAL